MATLDDLSKIIEPIDPTDLTDIFSQLQADLALVKASDNLDQLIASRDEMLVQMQDAIASAQISLTSAQNAQLEIKKSAVVKL
jgi:hypothetical protein